MQTLCEISVEAYLAADNPFDVVSRPEVCERCSEHDCFHRNGTYKRYVRQTYVKVARFLCALCGLSVSVLPAFVLPYRNRLVSEVNRFFGATDEQRLQISYGDVLGRYWQEWVGHMESVQRDSGWPVQQAIVREPRAYWEKMRKSAGSMAAAQVQLIGRYGISLLRRYLCHALPHASC